MLRTQQKMTYLLYTCAGTEADIRVDMTLHLTVVVAVCLWEHRENEHWVLKIQNENLDRCEWKRVFGFKKSTTLAPDDNSEIWAN